MVDGRQRQVDELQDMMTYLNDAILVDIIEHFVHHGRDDLLRTTGDGQSDRGGVEIAGESLCGENGLSLEEIPFSFMLDEGDEISDGTQDTSVGIRNAGNEGQTLTGRMWLLI